MTPWHQPRKRFGQHFLSNKRIIDDIIDAFNPKPDDYILEVGPGAGQLTDPLLHSGANLVAIEIDRDLARLLRQQYRDATRFHLLCDDVLRVDWELLCDDLMQHNRLRVIGNLPFNIATPLLIRLADEAHRLRDIFVMLQKEVALSVVASPNSADYGALSALLQSVFEASGGMVIDAAEFTPPPKVDSMMVRLVPRTNAFADRAAYLFYKDFVKKIFAHRRKTLRNILKSPSFNLLDSFEDTSIDLQRRAQSLSVDEMKRLSEAVCKAGVQSE